MTRENLLLNDENPIIHLLHDYENHIWKYRFNKVFQGKFEVLLKENINSLIEIKYKNPDGFDSILKFNLEFLRVKIERIEGANAKKESIITWFIFGMTGKANILPQLKEIRSEYEGLLFNGFVKRSNSIKLLLPWKEIAAVAYYVNFAPTEKILELNKNKRGYISLLEILYPAGTNFNTLRTNISYFGASNLPKIAKSTHEFLLNKKIDLGIPVKNDD